MAGCPLCACKFWIRRWGRLVECWDCGKRYLRAPVPRKEGRQG